VAKEGMRDVSAKTSSLRTAVALARLEVSPQSIVLIEQGQAPKGDPRPIARVAAIQAAKKTSDIIPYCHPVMVDYVGVEFELGESYIDVRVEVKAIDRTGVEMEAMTAAAAAALNLFDLLKPVDSHMLISYVRLEEKTGGKSQVPSGGNFRAAILIVSDSVSSGQKQDESGALMAELLAQHGGEVAERMCVADEPAQIVQALEKLMASRVDFIFLLGGTGAGPRDRTPETVLPMLDRRLNGLEHRILAYAQARLPAAMLGRPFAGVIGQTIVIGLPGSPGASTDAVNALFPYLTHALHIVQGGGHDEP
jgi:cyclic pyranopterin phosphate synthase